MQTDWLGLGGRVAVVTGGSGGIGKTIAASLVGAGCKVAILDINADAAAATASDLSANGATVIPAAADISDRDSVQAAADKIAAELGACDILVNNAALVRNGPLSSLSVADWKACIDVNLTGFFICSQVFGQQMMAGSGGAIVHVSSMAGLHPQPTSGAYSVSKAGVMMLSRNIAQEWGPKGIRSNVVSPAMVMTPMSEVIYRDPAVRKKREEIVPVGRIGAPQDIADSILFLASDRAGYVSGQDILCDGGWSTVLLKTVPRPGFDQPDD